MNIAQAKLIVIPTLLEWLGYVPVRERHGELWYASPFRQETEPSFKLSRDGKAWYDHGAGTGGNILDFAMAYFQTDVSGALRELERLQGIVPPYLPPLPAVINQCCTRRELPSLGHQDTKMH